MKAIVDASCAFVMLVAPERVEPFFADLIDVLAPELIVAELLNARWRLARSGAPAPSLDTMLELLDRIHLLSTQPYAADAATLAQRLDHPVYDCLYAVIAKRERAQLITADVRFTRKLVNEAIDVVTV